MIKRSLENVYIDYCLITRTCFDYLQMSQTEHWRYEKPDLALRIDAIKAA